MIRLIKIGRFKKMIYLISFILLLEFHKAVFWTLNKLKDKNYAIMIEGSLKYSILMILIAMKFSLLLKWNILFSLSIDSFDGLQLAVWVYEYSIWYAVVVLKKKESIKPVKEKKDPMRKWMLILNQHPVNRSSQSLSFSCNSLDIPYLLCQLYLVYRIAFFGLCSDFTTYCCW